MTCFPANCVVEAVQKGRVVFVVGGEPEPRIVAVVEGWVGTGVALPLWVLEDEVAGVVAAQRP